MRIKRFTLAAGCAALAVMSACASDAKDGSVSVNFAVAPDAKSLTVMHLDIDAILNTPRGQEPEIKTGEIPVDNLQAIIPLDIRSAEQYRVMLSDNPADGMILFFAEPGDNLTVAVESLSPFTYTVSGSPLMDGITELNLRLLPIEQELQRIETGELPESAYPELEKRYGDVLIEYVRQNPKNPAAVYAMLSMPDEQMTEGLKLVSMEDAKKSALYPYLESSIKNYERRQELEKKQRQMTSGTMDAPNFTLAGLDGKSVSLSDFRGKWVVLDFWGSWCGWCIKGMPAMKEAYDKYKGKLEIIGIDCGDTPEQWRAAVEKHKLPWVHVYNPKNSDANSGANGNADPTAAYGVQGFPTKVIVTPDGKIADIITGEDPAFYTTLSRLLQ